MRALEISLATLLLVAPASSALAADGGSNLCTTQACEVYASSDTDLYQVDPASLAQTHLCTFTGIPVDTVVTDIAVSTTGELWGVTEHALFTIDPTTCAATQVAALTPSGTDWVCLAFTADGTLVAADTTGDVATIDTTSGVVTSAGSFNGYGCSGDIIAIDDANHTIYATATDPTCTTDCYDQLVTLDPANGYAATVVGTTSYYTVFGLGYWGGEIYAFTHGGITLQLDPVSGAATYLSDTSPEVKFSGGATTPLAPTTCTNACDGGSTECVDDGGLATCFTESNGCTVWASSSCPAGDACSSGACVATCMDACTSGQTQCSATGQLETCEAQTSGCLGWTSAACPTGDVCSSGVCIAACTDGCSSGQAQCSGNSVQDCAQPTDGGCWFWNAGTPCPTNQVCTAGVCEATCANACVGGGVQCSGSIIQNCTSETDGCTAWVDGTDCGAAGCINGMCCACVAGETECLADGNVQVCEGTGSAVCPSWVTETCASGACAQGTCLTSCNPSSEIGTCPAPTVCIAVQGGDYCGTDADGGFTPEPTSGSGTSGSSGTTSPSGSGSGSGSTGTTSLSGSGSTGTTSPTGSGTNGGASGSTNGGTNAGAGSNAGNGASGTTSSGGPASTGASGGTIGGSGAGGTIGSASKAQKDGSVSAAGCNCSSGAESAGFGWVFGLLALARTARRSRPRFSAPE